METEEYFNEGTPFKSMTQGEVSKSMGVDTKTAHRFEINGYWVMVDSKMPTSEFNHIKNELIDYYDMMKIINKEK
jgi:hypothetical protein